MMAYHGNKSPAELNIVNVNACRCVRSEREREREKTNEDHWLLQRS
jgi:hypothetical protein